MIRPSRRRFLTAAVASAAVLLGMLPVHLRAADEEKQSEAEAKAELAARVKAWEDRLRDEAESQKEYWARRIEEDAEARAKAKVEMAQLREKAKGLKASSTPAEVAQALGKLTGEQNEIRGKKRSKTWSYLYYADEDCYLSFKVEFSADNTCKVHVVEKTREQAEAEPKHVLEAVFDESYYGYPSHERTGFSCKDASIDGKPVGKVPFVMTDDRPRVTGRMGPGAKIRIVYHGK